MVQQKAQQTPVARISGLETQPLPVVLAQWGGVGRGGAAEMDLAVQSMAQGSETAAAEEQRGSQSLKAPSRTRVPAAPQCSLRPVLTAGLNHSPLPASA